MQRVRAGGSLRKLRRERVHAFQKLAQFVVVVVINISDGWHWHIN